MIANLKVFLGLAAFVLAFVGCSSQRTSYRAYIDPGPFTTDQIEQITAGAGSNAPSTLRATCIRVGSWTSARYDQHLRYEIGDEDADAATTAHNEGREPMFRIERLLTGKTRANWVPEPGLTFGTREEAATALRNAVLGDLRKGGNRRGRTDRFRVGLAAVMACMVLQ